MIQPFQPLTLVRSCSNTYHTPSSSLISILLTAIVTTICLGSICCTHAKVSSALSKSSCQFSVDCRPNPHKICVSGECQCKPYFDQIPDLPKDDDCRKSYGASCTLFEDHPKEELCNVHKFLSCDNTRTCSCHIEGDSKLIYDEHLEKCVAPPGHQCEFLAFGGMKKECVQNAECVEDSNRIEDKAYFGVCECVEGYVGKYEKCIPDEGSRCELDGDCDMEGMGCLEGKCRCNPDRVYFEEEHECKIKVGQICELAKQECTDYADCIDTRDESHSWRWQFRCKCLLGYHENLENGTCERDAPYKCQPSMLYDEARSRCSLRVGQECRPKGINICVKHAFCGTGNKCQCYDGYFGTTIGTCEHQQNIVVIVDSEGKEEEKGEEFPVTPDNRRVTSSLKSEGRIRTGKNWALVFIVMLTKHFFEMGILLL